MRVLSLTHPDRIRAFLETDRSWAAYALGDLDPDFYKLTEWYAAATGDDLATLAMLYRGFDPPILFTLGEAAGLDRILAEAIEATRVSLSIQATHLASIERYYRLEEHWPMWRMTLAAGDFQPAQGNCVRLTLEDAGQLQRLYRLGGGDAFAPSQIESGVFFGIRQMGELIAVAGTHLVSQAQSVAAIGNVMTHPTRRGQGYATIATSAVCVELLSRGIRTIVLNVSQANPPAIHVYEKLGFIKYVSFYEGIAIRR